LRDGGMRQFCRCIAEFKASLLDHIMRCDRLPKLVIRAARSKGPEKDEKMNAVTPRVLLPILVTLGISALPASAQMAPMMGTGPMTGQGTAQGTAPWPSNTPPPCIAEFLKLRENVEKLGLAAKNARDHNASREEMCKLVTTFVGAEGKMVNYAATNGATCGIPAQAVQQMKEGHVRTVAVRQQICTAGPQPGNVAPTLSDALGTNTFPTQNTQAKRMGTFDTLTGDPLKQ
jgi:hypothetical protein